MEVVLEARGRELEALEAEEKSHTPACGGQVPGDFGG